MIDKRFPTLFQFNPENKEFILAALSIPEIKGDFIEDDLDFMFATQLLIAECGKYHSIEESEPVEEVMVADRGFMATFASRRNSRTSSIDNEIESDVKKYLSEKDRDLKLLNKYPYIRKVFLQYNTTLSSSAAVERVFSQSLMISTPRRNKLSAEHFEETLLLKHNKKLSQGKIPFVQLFD